MDRGIAILMAAMVVLGNPRSLLLADELSLTEGLGVPELNFQSVPPEAWTGCLQQEGDVTLSGAGAGLQPEGSEAILKASATGPTEVAFSSRGNLLSFSLNDEILIESFPGYHAHAKLLLGDGDHQLQWNHTHRFGEALIHSVAASPFTLTPLASVIDTQEHRLSGFVGNALALEESQVPRDREDAAVLSAGSGFTIATQGPGLLTFWHRATTFSSTFTLQASPPFEEPNIFNPRPNGKIELRSGPEWDLYTWEIPPATESITWLDNEKPLMLDQIRVFDLEPAEVLDPSIEVEQRGGSPWYGSVNNEGIAGFATAVPPDETSTLSLTLLGPGRLQIKSRTLAPRNTMTISVNGQEEAMHSGDHISKVYTRWLPDGEHLFELTAESRGRTATEWVQIESLEFAPRIDPDPIYEALDLSPDIGISNLAYNTFEPFLVQSEDTYHGDTAIRFQGVSTTELIPTAGKMITLAFKGQVSGLPRQTQAGDSWRTLRLGPEDPPFSILAEWRGTLDALKVWTLDENNLDVVGALSESIGGQITSDIPNSWQRWFSDDEEQFMVSPAADWSQFEINGPGVLKFVWRTSGLATCTVDEMITLDGSLTWPEQHVAIDLPSGRHRIRFEALQTGPSWIRQPTFEPGESLPVRSLLGGVVGLAPIIVAGGRPTVLEGGEEMELGPSDVELVTLLSSPGVLTLPYRSTVQEDTLNQGQVELSSQGGLTRLDILDSAEWQTHQLPLPNPPHQLRIALNTDWRESTSSSLLYLRAPSIQPLVEQDLAFPLSNRTGPWTMLPGSSEVPPAIETSDTTVQEAWLEQTLSGPAEILYEWHSIGPEDVTKEAQLLVNELVLGRLETGGNELRRDALLIPAGEHTIRWLAPEAAGLFVRPLSYHMDPDSRAATAIGDTTRPWLIADISGIEAPILANPAGLPPGSWHPVSTRVGASNYGFVRGSASLYAGAKIDKQFGRFGWVFSNKGDFAFGGLLRPGEFQLSLTDSEGPTTLRNFSFVEGRVIPLDEALDHTGSWRTSETAPWQGLSGGLLPGQDDIAISSEVAFGETSWIETSIVGPAHFSFCGFVNSHDVDEMTFELNGQRQASITLPHSGQTVPHSELSKGWPEVRYDLPSGLHVCRWTYTHDGQTPSVANFAPTVAYLDSVSATPFDDGFARALDLDDEWFISASGNTAAPIVAGDPRVQLGDSLVILPKYSRMGLRITGPGFIQFKAHSDESSNAISIDPLGERSSIFGNSSARSIALPKGWSQHGFSLKSGTHDFTWISSRLASTTLVDAVSIGPLPTLQEALGSTHPITSEGQWTPRFESIAPSGHYLERLDKAPAVLSTTLASPGTLSFWWRTSSSGSLSLTSDGQILANIARHVGVEAPWNQVVVSLSEKDTALRLVASGQGPVAIGGISFQPDSTASSYQDWLRESNLSPSEQNLLTYAFGSDEAISLALSESLSDVQVSIRRRKDPALRHRIEWSDDLNSWEDITSSAVKAIDRGDAWEDFNLLRDLGDTERAYVRVQVSLLGE